MDNQQVAVDEQTRKTHYEQIVIKGQQTFIEVGQALLALKEEELFKVTHKTWKDYTQDTFGFSDRHARRLISSVEAAQDVCEDGSFGGPIGPASCPSSEAVARELVPLDTAKEREKLWKTAVNTAPKSNAGTPIITASHVAKERTRLFGSNGAAPSAENKIKSFADRINKIEDELSSLAQSYKPENMSWQTALDALEEARLAVQRLR